jgi:hypothetical protein
MIGGGCEIKDKGEKEVRTAKVEEEGKMKQKHHVQTKEINYLQVFAEGKVIKESRRAHRNKTLKIFHQNIRGLGNKTNELYCHLHHDQKIGIGVSSLQYTRRET